MSAGRRVDLSSLPVVDGHCHPLLPDPWTVSPEAFVDLFSEGRQGSMTTHVPHTGYYRRALAALARRLGTEPTVEAVLERRRELGADASRCWLSESRITSLLVDTGYPSHAMPLAEMRRLLPPTVRQVFRIEACAQNLLSKSLPYDDYIEAFRQELCVAAERCVAFKSIIAYRSGLAVRVSGPGEASRAYDRAIARVQAGESPRLTEKPLLDTLFHMTLDVSTETGLPLQVHAGIGDPDIDLLQANPLLLRPILEDPRWVGVRLVILHLAYPYFREASFMAAVWPQVSVDLSLALPVLGAGAIPPLIEVLSLAPASKLLYGSDLGGLPELYALAAEWARETLGGALEWLIEHDGLAVEDARVSGGLMLAENARALYHLRD